MVNACVSGGAIICMLLMVVVMDTSMMMKVVNCLVMKIAIDGGGGCALCDSNGDGHG